MSEYQYWLSPAVISPFIEQAQSQLQQEQADSGYDAASHYKLLPMKPLCVDL